MAQVFGWRVFWLVAFLFVAARPSVAAPYDIAGQDSLNAQTQTRARSASVLELVVESDLFLTTDLDQSLVLAQRAYDQSLQGTSPQARLEAQIQLGRISARLGKRVQARKLLEDANAVVTDEVAPRLRSRLYYALGLVNHQEGYYNQALTYHYKAQRAAEEDQPALSREFARSLYGVAQTLFFLKDYPQATVFANRSLEAHKNIDDRNGVGAALRLLGDVDLAAGNSIAAMDLYRQAQAVLPTNNVREQVQVGLSLSRTLLLMDNYSAAVPELRSSLVLADSGALHAERAEIFNLLARAFLGMGERKKAITYAEIALRLARRHRAAEQDAEANRLLSSIYGQLGSYDLALNYYKNYVSVRDRLRSQELARQTTEMRIRYQTEKIGKEIAVLTRENRIRELDIARKNTLLYTSSGIAAVLIATAFVLFRQSRRRRRLNRILQQKNDEILRQKGLIETSRDQLEASKRQLDEAFGRIHASITYAKRLQEAILPNPALLGRYVADPLVYYRPKDIVSGDFYWFSQANGHLYLVAADCTGHGVPGAFMSVIGHSLLVRAINELKLTDPGQILSMMHEGVIEALQQRETHNRDGIDLGICVYEPASGRLEFAGARNTMLIITPDQATPLVGDRHSIGGLQGREASVRTFRTHHWQVRGRTSVYLYSDGYADQFNSGFKRKFSVTGLRQLLQQVHELDTEGQERELDRHLAEWQDGHEQTDDILIIGGRLPEPRVG